ncbi:MAG TPA: non-ribosomal peptide synthetase [Candidatus Saccharimonadales bacterium]|jgi:amino acid adenylation domain-containing protein|nr:non-ribosomal peptide synthetase [Candidatus Saccharimonadales bacterium]
MFSAQESADLVVSSKAVNSARVSSDAPECLQRLFEAQVERTPNASAIVALDGQFSYSELNRRSNQLAHYLQSLGLGPEMRVGIALPRSGEMIVAMMAVLKAGGVYVPLDLSYPPQRFKYLAEDSKISILLTQRAVPEGLNPELAIVSLDKHRSEIAALSESNPDSECEPANLAYIIYTSGSSGQPKGVMVSHENLVRSTHARVGYYSRPPARFLLLSSFAFDSSVAGIFWTLLAGGELRLPPEGAQRNIARITQFIFHGKITHLLSLPSLYKSLLLQPTFDAFVSLEAVIVAGESCPSDLVAAHARHLPKVTLYNEYGPTEATVWCTVHQIDSSKDTSSVPIGKAIPEMQVHVLDQDMKTVEPGKEGEIYIGGAQLARGYLERPDLTAEKFVPNPFPEARGLRLYRTGDLASLNQDGDINFLGRADLQVKIRGYRIELGEIESALREHQHVGEAAVAGRKDQAGRERLVAYVVPKTTEIDMAALQSFLSHRLPAYMVPATYVMLDALPMNANGKLDRRALPEPKQTDLQYAPPRNDTEERLAGIWAQLLGVAQVGIHDKFADLGGDSIVGLQVVARANQAGIRINLTEIVQESTIAKLAASCTS